MACVQHEDSQLEEAEAEAALDEALSSSLSFSVPLSINVVSACTSPPALVINSTSGNTTRFSVSGNNYSSPYILRTSEHGGSQYSSPENKSFQENNTKPSSSSPQISFSFPDWDLQLCKNSFNSNKFSKKSISSTVSKSLKNDDNPEEKSKLGASLELLGEIPVNNNNGPIFLHLPEETLFSILSQLNAVELCSFRSVSKKCHDLASKEDLWEPLLLHRLGLNVGLPSGVSSRLRYKSFVLTANAEFRFRIPRYEFIREALDFWWEAGGNVSEKGVYNSVSVKKILKKLTICNWSLLYEALAVAFSYRADCIAESLSIEMKEFFLSFSKKKEESTLEEDSRLGFGRDKKKKKMEMETKTAYESFEKTKDVTDTPGSSNGRNSNLNCDNDSENMNDVDRRYESSKENAERNERNKIVEENDDNVNINDVEKQSGSTKDKTERNKRKKIVEENERQWMLKEHDQMGRLGLGFSEKEILVGLQLWKVLVQKWGVYKRWLKLIANHCSFLQFEVMLERARATSISATPTLYDKGIISFRSHVLLGFGLRRSLQAGLSSLSFSDSRGLSSEKETSLLKSIRHLYQELDLTDDSTGPPRSFSQQKFRRCFRVLVISGLLPHNVSARELLPTLLFGEEEEEI